MSTLHEPLFIIAMMIFLHIVDDYYLQGKLCDLKQKIWWEKNVSDGRYKYDYIVALFMHGFSWSFLTMIPLALYSYSPVWIIFVIFNACVHSYIDNMKANKLSINLTTDQLLHLIQIAVSFGTYLLL